MSAVTTFISKQKENYHQKKLWQIHLRVFVYFFFGLGHTVTFFTHMINNVRKSTAEHPNLFSVWNFDLSFTLLYITKGTITSRILFHYSSHPLGITLEWLSIYQVWFFTYYKWIHPQTDFFRHIRLFNYCTQKYLLYLDKNVCSSCNLNW